MLRFMPGAKSPKSVLLLCILIILSLSLFPNLAQADAGDLDPTFGDGGKVLDSLSSVSDSIDDIALQSDGKVIAAGRGISSFPFLNFVVVRYNSDGSLDTSFGAGGRVVTDFFGRNDEAFSILIQPDGRIIVAGVVQTQEDFNSRDFGLIRYNTDGSVDSTFGNEGKVVTDFSSGSDVAADIALQRDGKIVAAGTTINNLAGIFDFALARYESDGSLDSEFGKDGKVATDFFGQGETAIGVAIQTDGKIIASGQAASFETGNDFALARYNQDGSLDTGFGTGGKVSTHFPSFVFEEARDVLVQPDGRIVLGGRAFDLNTGGDFALARYNTNGSLDSSFGSGGLVLTDFFRQGDVIEELAIQPNGKIIAVGSAITPHVDFALARYNTDGSLDTSFGSDGKVNTDFLNNYNSASTGVLQPDGKIIAAGALFNGNASDDFALARYEGDGTSFDICVQDEDGGGLLQISSTTGDYLFSDCAAFTITGTGTVSIRGCNIALNHTTSDRRIIAKVNSCSNRATASIQSFSDGSRINITDRNTANNSCACQ